MHSGAPLSRLSKIKNSTGATSASTSIRSRVRSILAHTWIISDLTLRKKGNEDHVIVISVVRTKELGFLQNLRRTNVMLTRCQRGMFIVSSKAFLEGKGADSLVGKMAAELGKRPGAWLTQKDLEQWTPEYSAGFN